MKVSTKLVILISLGIVMIGFQFGVNRYLNRKMSEYNRATHELNRMSESLLSAIIEEKNFDATHSEDALKEALRYAEEAEKDAQKLMIHTVVSSSAVKELLGLIDNYQVSFSNQAKLIKQLDSVENHIDRAIGIFNENSEGIIKQINTYIGTALTNVEEVDEHIRSLADVIRDVAFTVNRIFLVLNEDLFRKDDMSAYLLHTNDAFKALQREKKNAAALSNLVTDERYSKFINLMIKTIDRIPDESKEVRRIWVDKDVNQAQLDGIRLQVLKAKERMLTNADKSMDEFNNQLLIVNGLAFAASVLVLFFIGMGIIQSITKPIGAMTASAKEIAEGNLSHAATVFADLDPEQQSSQANKETNNEIRQLSAAFGRMARSLQSLIGQVQKSGIQVVSSATEISASAGQLKETAAEQVVSVNQVGATSRNISTRSQQLSSTMNEVAELVSETATLAEQGQGGLGRLQSSMQLLMQATGSIAQKLESINEKTHGIDTIVTTITKVAAQTNLLSLNAAIEAEKAGEYGYGFSVVSQEIRRLADQTAVATLDIEKMVQGMQSAVTSGVMEVDKFLQQVRQGVQNVDQIGGQLSTIIDRVQALTPHFDAVNESMQSQSEGAEEISEAMGQLSETAELTNQVIHDFKVATEQLTEAAQALQAEVAQFRVESDTNYSRSETSHPQRV